jgi:pilus assembly protein Flp/PilA
MKSLIVRFVREDAGQDLIEYGLLVGIITVGAVAAITLIGTDVKTIFENTQTKVTAPAAAK